MLRHHPPSPDANQLAADAMRLTPRKRAWLSDLLLESLEPAADPGAAEAWEREIARRVARLDAGKARFVTWEQIRKNLVSTKKRRKA
jgi:putative addiction module component (TIGR02574 family)